MPILGKTPRACFNAFVAHINPLVAATLPTHVPLEAAVFGANSTTAVLGFRGAYTVPLSTRDHGTVHLHIGQWLECTEDKKRSANQRYKLGTRKYWYRIQSGNGNSADAVVRWEYVSPVLPEYAGKHHCWRHVQMPQCRVAPSQASVARPRASAAAARSSCPAPLSRR